MDRMLRMTRGWCRRFDDRLTAMSVWTDTDLRLLRLILRAYAVAIVSASLSPWRRAYHALRIVTAVIVIALPESSHLRMVDRRGHGRVLQWPGGGVTALVVAALPPRASQCRSRPLLFSR